MLSVQYGESFLHELLMLRHSRHGNLLDNHRQLSGYEVPQCVIRIAGFKVLV